jgi:hypothetical protein
MTTTARLCTILALCLFLGACGTATGLVGAGQGVTDRLVERAGAAADKVMVALDAAEAIAIVELARIRAARCKNFFPALVRYALSSAEKRQVIERDCRLVVELDGARVLVDPGAAP